MRLEKLFLNLLLSWVPFYYTYVLKALPGLHKYSVFCFLAVFYFRDVVMIQSNSNLSVILPKIASQKTHKYAWGYSKKIHIFSKKF